MTDWIIWYDDKSSFSSDDGEPWDAPRDGVICISVARRACGRYVIHQTNFYCWHFEDNKWVPHDKSGERQYLRKPGKEKLVLEGYWIPNEKFGEIKHHALKVDDRLPPLTSNPPRLPEGIRHDLED
jgi:hypothetical protein